ncbi:Hypothetical protein A7982_05305 [Minicystis rosea]|nr:Hypothetical protein A7982_05305 [Minicystis rosea]
MRSSTMLSSSDDREGAWQDFGRREADVDERGAVELGTRRAIGASRSELGD